MSRISQHLPKHFTCGNGKANHDHGYVDGAGPVNSHMFLIVVDANSKWVEVLPLKLVTSAVVIHCMEDLGCLTT